METQTIKIWKITLKKLRMIYALTGESMVSILERVVSRELEYTECKDDNIQSIQSGTRSK